MTATLPQALSSIAAPLISDFANATQAKPLRMTGMTLPMTRSMTGIALTDKKFPGNPTKSYRTRDPLRVMGEVTHWKGHSPEQLKTMKDRLAHLKRLSIEAIED